jgi:peptidoglycan/xylan/chitin deacetylase (PgdA/CDA1 family)
LHAAITGRYRIPVLVYHTITRDDALARRLMGGTSRAAFEEQMRWLADGGYQVLSMAEYAGYVEQRQPFPPRSVLITFDDGYRSVYTRAFPVLQKHGFAAVVFVVSSFIGGQRRFPPDEKYRDLSAEAADELRPLNWDELRAMRPLLDVGSHTASHPHLARLPAADVSRELTDSKAVIEAALGVSCPWFAYPGGTRATGDVSAATRQAVIVAGFHLAFINEIGRNTPETDPYEQDRIALAGRQSRLLFTSKLHGGYDWVGGVYRLVRPLVMTRL